MVMHCPLGILLVNLPGCSCSCCLSAVFSFRPDTFVWGGGGCQVTARAHSIAKEKIQTFGGGGGICCGAEVGKNRPFFYMVMEKGVVDVQ